MNAYVHRCWRTAAPVMISLVDGLLEIKNPGELLPGLHVSSLLHGVPAYRNLLVAEAGRFIWLCDKVGKGIDVVFESALEGGLDVPIFESCDNHFTARLSMIRSDNFREFVQRRGASLSSMDEILALRILWSRRDASIDEISSVLQRGFEQTQRVLGEMARKLMIEITAANRCQLSSIVRMDIDHIFEADQLPLDLFQG